MSLERREFKDEYVLEEAFSDFFENIFFCRKKDHDGHLSAERFPVKVFDQRKRAMRDMKIVPWNGCSAARHSNILAVCDHFGEEVNGTFYLVSWIYTLQCIRISFRSCAFQVFESASGGTLFDHFVEVFGNRPMPEKGLQLVARQLLRGLSHAHLDDTVLDFNLENILLKNVVTLDDWKEAQDNVDAAIQLKIVGFRSGIKAKAICSDDIFTCGQVLCFLANGIGMPLVSLVPPTLAGYSPAFQDMIFRLLDPDPETRITARDALLHPWVVGDCAWTDSLALNSIEYFPFEERKLRILSDFGLPEVINLGQYSWHEDGDTYVHDFQPLTAAELRKLIEKLYTHRNVKVLALGGNEMGNELMLELAVPLKMLSALEYLYLWGNNIGSEGLAAVSESIRGLVSLKTLWLQSNNADVGSVCRLVPCLLNLTRLSVLHLDFPPFSCIRDEAWKQLNLATPPDEIRTDWIRLLEFLRVGQCVHVHELRLMLIGDGEVGKTSLQNAFQSPGRKAAPISKQQRTAGIDISELQFASANGPTLTCQVCDFAGQEIYYFSHTMHFTRRCLYVLVWTAHKFSESGAPQALSIADIMGPLKRWLHLLAANVPESNILVVGSHCQVEREGFCAMQTLVEEQLKQELDRLRFIAVAESVATRQLLQWQLDKEQILYDEIKAELSASSLQLSAPLQMLENVTAFVHQLDAFKPALKRGLRRRARLLLTTMLQSAKTKARLCRLHAVYDGSVPCTDIPVAQLKLVHGRSFAVDSIAGVGITELLAAIEATCRDRHALPFMGEQVPVSWIQVMAALDRDEVKDRIGDGVLPLKEAAGKVHFAIDSKLEVDSVQKCLEFWSLLGRVFVYEGHFLRDPRRIIDLLKPLIHHNVVELGYRKEFLVNPTDVSCDRLLEQMHKHAVLDHRLLPHLKVWSTSSTQTHKSMLQFFKESFMISDMRSDERGICGAGAEPTLSLVTARLFDHCDVDRQQEVYAHVDKITHHALFHALYALPSVHVGIIAELMATIKALQPLIAFVVKCTQNSVYIQLGPSQCAISARSLGDVFASKLGSIKDELRLDVFAHALIISSNDDGLFAFSARCVDAMMQSGSFGAMHQCWLPYRSSAADTDWRPKREDWLEVNSPENPKSLSEILSANSSDLVIAKPARLRLKDIFPRKPRLFMSHAYAGDGTGECCQRIKDKLQELLLCTVWFDKAEMGWTDSFIDQMKHGMANASVFVICLSPLYLTRPNCLRELMWAMRLCCADKCKKLCVLPMHPSVSFAGCKAIIDLAAAGCAAQVILPADDRSKEEPTQLKQLKAHKLSDVAVELLQRLTGSENVGMIADWLKLQPWLSDTAGENWEETSQPWHGPCEGKSVDMTQLIQALALDVQSSVLVARPPAPWSAFTDVEDHVLRSFPPSQDYQAPPDTALLMRAFPQLLRNFSEAEAVKLMLLGLRDSQVMDCAKYGLTKTSSVAESRLNPVDPVFRMAADMSGCFSSARTLIRASQPDDFDESKPVPHNSNVFAETRSFISFRNAAVSAAALAVLMCAISFFKRRLK
jgi:GTPase SAR1 family protein